MPDVIDPPEKPFSQQLKESLPSNAQSKTSSSADAVTHEEIPSDKGKVATVPAATKTEAKSGVALDPDSEILEGKRSPKSDDFQRVKRAATEANKLAEELKSRLEKAEAAMSPKRDLEKSAKELTEAQKERDELKAKWQLVAAQFDAGFHTKYDAKVGDAISKIKDAVPADKIERLTWLVQQPEGNEKRKAMLEITEDLDPIAINEITQANREVREILAARKKELDDSGTILKTSAEQRQKEQDERKTAYTKSFDDVLAKARALVGDSASPMYQLRDGDDAETKAWNAGVEERSAVARKGYFDEFDSAEDRAEFSLNATAYPVALQFIKELQAKLAAADETLGKMQSTSPGIRTGGVKGGAVEKSFTQEMMERAQ